MPGSLLPQFFINPSGNPAQLFIIIIHRRNNVSNNFDVHIPFGFSPLCHLQDTAPVRNLCQVLIKRIGKTFDIDAPHIQIRADNIQRLRTEIAVGHINRVEIILFRQLGTIQCIFKPHRRLIVRPSDSGTVVAFRQFDSFLG